MEDSADELIGGGRGGGRRREVGEQDGVGGGCASGGAGGGLEQGGEMKKEKRRKKPRRSRGVDDNELMKQPLERRWPGSLMHTQRTFVYQSVLLLYPVKRFVRCARNINERRRQRGSGGGRAELL